MVNDTWLQSRFLSKVSKHNKAIFHELLFINLEWIESGGLAG